MPAASEPDAQLAIGQVAVNHLHAGTREWYGDGLGLLPRGASLFAGPPASKVNGLPFPVFFARWLVDGRELTQLELFRWRRPRSAPRRADETAADHGYRRVGFFVRDFDATLARLAALGTEPAGPVLGEPGERRACVRDPEGNWTELHEADPLAGTGPAGGDPAAGALLRSVTLSVGDLDTAAEQWVGGVGLPRAAVALHGEEDEALWGLAGARRRCLVLDGRGILLELVEYVEPAGRPPPPGWRICDQGIMNVAIVVRDRAAFDRAFERWRARGLRPTSPTPLELGIFRVMYFRLPGGESVELLYPRRWGWRLTGFAAGGRPGRRRREAAG